MQNEQFPRRHFYVPFGELVHLHMQYCSFVNSILKHLTNTRASGSDDALKLTPPKILSLEEALDFIDTDELLEVTPNHLRIRKKILDPKLRKRASFKK